jgi:hypothetical protein
MTALTDRTKEGWVVWGQASGGGGTGGGYGQGEKHGVHGPVRGKEKGKRDGPKETIHFSNYLKIFKMTRIDSIKRWSSRHEKNSNKIWLDRELNKKQLSVLEIFKIQYII